MKFTLYPNDELKFKIKQRWDLSAPEVLVVDSWCYKQIKYLIASIKNYNPTRNTYWDRLVFLEIKKGTGTIIYEVEDMQLDFQGQGEKLKVISIEVSVDDTAKNYRTIYIFFDENKLSIMLCYEFDSYSFTPYGIKKLSEGNYTFSSYMEKLNIRKYLNDSSEILPELETNMVQPS